MARMKTLPLAIQCPSVGSATDELEHVDCSGNACTWWKNGGCSARVETEEVFLVKETKLAAECPLASRCRWHIDAVAEGKVGCVIRRLGMLCEHQGGEWNTFQMAPPEEWGDDPLPTEESDDE
jgi:hypothetical protein